MVYRFYMHVGERLKLVLLYVQNYFDVDVFQTLKINFDCVDTAKIDRQYYKFMYEKWKLTWKTKSIIMQQCDVKPYTQMFLVRIR